MYPYARPTKILPTPCAMGWFALPKRKKRACLKCGAEFGQTCKAERRNIIRERRVAT